MKKIFLILTILIIITGCTKSKSNDPIISQKENIVKEEIIPKYEDHNPVKVAFYDDKKNIITAYNCSFVQYKDIAWLSIFPSNDSVINYTTLKDTWTRYKEQYNEINYKFGINIKYELKNGEKINLNILKPSDNASIFEYIQIYLYDGYNAKTSWYDHLEDNEITDETVFTSIKLTGSTYIDDIISPITLTVFTYDGLDDFDENSNYIGNSKYTITLENIN